MQPRGWSRVALLSLVLAAAIPAAAALAGDVKTVEVLFVQSARNVVFEGETLTLKDISPSTLFFSERPERIAGHYTNDEYLKAWTEGRDSFLKDPPNAVVSIFTRADADPTDVVVTLRNPRLSGHDMKYDIKLIQGKPPAEGGATAVFIDIIGLPFTPLSFAGVARRTAYRSMAYGAAASGAAAAQSEAATSAEASAAAASQAAAAANKAAGQAAAAAAPQQTPAQRLQELESLYKQGLITQSDYEAGKAKILAEITQ
ncbi:MAG TPA: SHOCT domain-containing protein [Thermoanaerobaculia bacterium]|nr:SHOCT domain-containing protein [Thermoanaerobaculia bacterium]